MMDPGRSTSRSHKVGVPPLPGAITGWRGGRSSPLVIVVPANARRATRHNISSNLFKDVVLSRGQLFRDIVQNHRPQMAKAE